MAKTLPPGFEGTDFTKFREWPVTYVDGLPYRQIPGNDAYLFDEYDGQFGSIKINPKHIEKSLEADQPKEPGIVEQIAPAAGLLGGLYAVKNSDKILDGSIFSTSGAEATKQTASNILGNSVEVAGVADTTGVAAQAANQGGILGGAPATPTGLSGQMVPVGAEAPPTILGSQGLAQGLGAAGVALGTYGAYKGIKEGNPLQSGLGGAGIGLGLNTMGYTLGPWGWGATLALPVAASLLGGLGDKDMFKTEGNRLNKLREQGVNVPQSLLDSMPSQGRSKSELIELERSRPDGNVTFAGSRKESDLRPQDIVGYATFAENDPNWFNKPLEEQLKVADQALKAGAVREHHGTIDVDFSKLNQPITKQEEQKKASTFGQTVGGALQRPTFPQGFR